jgi:hypothetical protein
MKAMVVLLWLVDLAVLDKAMGVLLWLADLAVLDNEKDSEVVGPTFWFLVADGAVSASLGDRRLLVVGLNRVRQISVSII